VTPGLGPWIAYLKQMHSDAGRPMLRDIAACSGVSYTTVAGMLNGDQVSRLQTTRRVILAISGRQMDADAEHLWATAKAGRTAGGRRSLQGTQPRSTADLDKTIGQIEVVVELLTGMVQELDRYVRSVTQPDDADPEQG
jgi:hypothetical protein